MITWNLFMSQKLSEMFIYIEITMRRIIAVVEIVLYRPDFDKSICSSSTKGNVYHRSSKKY